MALNRCLVFPKHVIAVTFYTLSALAAGGGSLFFSSQTLGQEQMLLKNGLQIDGEFDRSTVADTVFRFRRTGMKKFNTLPRDRFFWVRSNDGSLLYPQSLVGNSKSRQYHIPSVLHLPDSSIAVRFASESEAQGAGYKPCPACLQRLPPQIDIYDLERELFYEAGAQFQDRNETVYEHPGLQYVQSMVTDILRHWPEPLKGYSYRAQIYRDDVPNAGASAQGHVYVTTALLETVEDSAELRAALAHEVAHIERRHMLREYLAFQKKKDQDSWTVLAIGVLTGVAAGAASGDARVGALTAGVALSIGTSIADYARQLVRFGFRREQEEEADVMTQIYFLRAGYQKKSIVSLFDKLATRALVQGYSPWHGERADHPPMVARRRQVESATLSTPPTPIEFTASALTVDEGSGDRIFSGQIDQIFTVLTSEPPFVEYLVYLLGSAQSEIDHDLIRIDRLFLKVHDTGKAYECVGLEGQILRPLQRGEYCVMLKVGHEESRKLVDAILSRNVSWEDVNVTTLTPEKRGQNLGLTERVVSAKMSFR